LLISSGKRLCSIKLYDLYSLAAINILLQNGLPQHLQIRPVCLLHFYDKALPLSPVMATVQLQPSALPEDSPSWLSSQRPTSMWAGLL
jgi:hypothetical protein